MPLQSALQTLSGQIAHAVDWFLPPDFGDDKDRIRQARVFLISHLFGPFIGNLVTIALLVLDPTPGLPAFVVGASISGFWIFPFLLKLTGKYNLLAFLSVENLIFVILWGCYFYGGMSAPFLPWILIIPLLAFFYVGGNTSWRLSILALFAVNLTVFGVTYAQIYAPRPDLSEIGLSILGAVSTVGVCAYVIMMSFYYARTLASQAELEIEVKHHLATAAQLREATASAERANAAKSEFLAKTSHELRTPLNAIIGYSEMLLEEAQDSKDDFGTEDLHRIRGAGRQLLALVNDVLDLSKISAGKMELFIEEVNLVHLLTAGAEGFRKAAKENGTGLELDIPAELGIGACDAHKLSQVMSQLLSNAVKFTEGGTISVTARRDDTASGPLLTISIEDTGNGIAPETMARLFDVFTGAEDYSSSKYGGTGLGLALSKKLCELMGGTISASSDLGVGSRFVVTLPIDRETIQPQQKSEQALPEEEGPLGVVA